MSVAEDRLRSEAHRLREERDAALEAAERAERRYQELSHRVKNEFQQVAALVRLQESGSAEPERCRRCAANVTAFSELHRLLDLAGMEAVSMRDYMASLERTLGLALEGRCRFAARADEDILLPPRPAARLGIIVTEAVMNAVKHAFPEPQTGRVEASLTREDARLVLTVRDNGRGRDPASRTGKGSALISAMAAALGGETDYPQVSAGTCVRVRLPAF
ncbi:sensor histidine kinase [Marinicauda algicola]|uniref:histidine kinase n=1 Tax=Marinicauda algicola TaxID=2029849 RepID=A0A4S2GX57_9PROT|nr:sensor histidine kinase [Marinicauda algicola]TGY87760.1 sensor histidine kinase [Marinicauda algicola]